MNTEMFVQKELKKLDSSRSDFLSSDSQKNKRLSFVDQILHCLIVAMLAVLCYLFVSHDFLQSVEVIGESMVPTLHPTERYLLNRWVYRVRDPEPGDIVVIQDPTDGQFSVKRIIAGSGDSVYLKNGSVFVNGHELKEPYLPRGTRTYPSETVKGKFIVCGNNQYFVLGDNRNNSLDSRVYGAIPRQNILGTVVP